MSQNLERYASMKGIYGRASHIIGQNKGIKLSKEILRQLRQAGLKLIPQQDSEI